MLFNSYSFLFLFLPVFLVLYYSTNRYKTHVLTAGSYFFYMGWRPAGAVLLLGATLINYLFGKAIFNTTSLRSRKLFCGLSVAANLVILSYFKYLGFFGRSLNALAGRDVVTPADIALPIGISFFLFQCISYTVDLYRGRVKPARSFLDFACYVSLFPHLVAGPIIRYSFIEKQLEHRVYSYRMFADGVVFFVVGLAKKVLIADTLAVTANALFQAQSPDAAACWIGMIAYTLQIFYDFSGYSDMAIGLGRMIGFRIPQNFNSPYLSKSISEFWRRWHMSLSFWLRDFLYIPLGGSRLGRFRTYVNLTITMLLGGLWHGASWTFVFWGMLHGAFLVVERALGDRYPVRRLPDWAQIVFTNFLVVIAWAFFRSESFAQAFRIVAGMFGFLPGATAGAAFLNWNFVAVCVLGVLLIIRGENIFDKKWAYTPLFISILMLLFILCSILVLARNYSPFLYAQF